MTEGVCPPPPPELLDVEELPPQPARDRIPNITISQVQVRGGNAEIRTNTSLGDTFMRKLSDEAGGNLATYVIHVDRLERPA